MKTPTTKKLVLSALFASLTMIATMFIRIPLPMGYVNLGDAFVFLSVFILGPIYGTTAAGVGSTLADLFGYPSYAPGTLLIKTVMALVAYVLYKLLRNATKKAVLAEIAAGIIGTLIMAFGYFVYETLFFSTAAAAIVNAPWNLLQGGIGVVISVIVMRVLTATKFLEKIQK